MSLELSSIAFKVETGELDTAVTKLGNLQKALSDVNKPLTKLADTSEDAAKGVSKLADAEEGAEKKLTAVERRLEQQATKMKVLRDETIQLTDGVEKLGKGYTSGQAGQLATLKLLGATSQQVKALAQSFKEYNDITGINTFDASANGLSRVNKEIRELSQVNVLASKGLGLTREELKFLARDTNALTQAFNAEGRSSEELSSAIQRLNSEFVEASKTRNKLVAESKAYEAALLNEAKAQAESTRLQQDSSEAMFRNHLAKQEQIRKTHEQVMKEMRDFYKQEEKQNGTAKAQVAPDAHVLQFYKQQEQAANSAAKATNYLEREMQRAENALAGLNENMFISSSNRLLRFKEGLVASGVASDEAARRYQAYAKVLADTDAKRSAQSKNSREDELKYLARATSVQLGDIGVSLAGGQNPFTVMIQQGDQLRAVLNQVGGDAKEMQSAMSTAFKQIVVGFVDVGKALGTFVVGAFKDSAISITKFTGEVTGLASAYDYLRYQMILASTDTDKFVSTLGKFGSTVLNSIGAVTIPMIATGLAGLAIAAVTAAVALKQLISEESNFSKVLNLNGAALGLNRDAAYTLATTYAGARGDINGYVAAMTEAAKAGNISAASLKTVTDSAVYMKSVAGVAIEDTVKQFSELAKDPVKALEKLALNLGTIDVETVKHIRSLKEQGKEAEATEKAIEAYGKGLTKAAAGIKTDMGYLESFFKTIGSAASSMWDKILNIGREGTLKQQIDATTEKIRSLSAGEGIFILSDRNVTLGIEKAKLEGLEKQLAAQDALNASKVKNVALLKSDSDVNSLMDQFTEKSDKKNKAIQEVNATFNTAIELAKKYNKDTAELEANRAKALAGVEEKFKVRAKKDPTETAYQKAIKTFTNDANAATAAQENYTKAQQDFLNIATSSDWNKFSPDEKQNIVRLAEEAIARETLTKSINEQWEAEKRLIVGRFKSEGDISELEKSREQRGDSEIINAQNKLQLLDEELADMLLQKAIYGELTAEQKKQIEYAKIQKEYKAEELRITKLLADPKSGIDEMTALWLRNINYEAAAKKRQNIDQAIILENNKYEYEQRVQLAAGISSSIETALFEGGQAGSKKLREVIEAELRKPITLFIQAFVQDIFGLNGAGDTMSKAVSAFDKVSSFFSSGGTNNLVSSGLTKLMSSEVGYNLGLANPTGYTTGSGVSYSANSTGSMLSKTAGQIGGAMTAYGIQKGLSGGYKTGESGAVDALTAIGGFFDPTGGLIAGTIGAAVNRAFGRKLTETGIEGTFGGSQGFAGNQYSFEKGGWLRSDRTKTSALDSGIQQGFAGQFNVLRAGIALMSTSLGLGTKSIEDFTYKFKLNLMGLSEAEATKKIKEEFDKVGIAIADTIPELKEYQKQGETNLDTLTRLSTSLGTVNSTFELLGFKLEDLSLSGAAAADTIVTAYGSLETFSSKMQAYYDSFYSDEEKQAATLKGISSALKAAGVDIGDVSKLTREEFRSIIDSMVKTKGAADPAVVALISVAPAFASVKKSAKELAEEANQSAEKIKEATAKIYDTAKQATQKTVDVTYSLLKKSIENQKEVLNQQISSLEKTETALQGVFDLISTNVKELYSEVTSTASMQLRLAYGVISNAISTGSLPSQSILSEAIGSVRGSFDNSNFASKYEADKARLSFANDLEKLQKLSGVQISDSQQQIKLLKEQVTQYDDVLLNAEKQINELRGINTSVLSVGNAIDALARAMKVETNLTTGSAGRTDAFAVGKPTYGNLNDTQAVFARSYAQSLQWGTESTDVQSTLLLADYAKANGITQADLADVLGFSPDQMKSHFDKYGIPAFATGGLHSGGIRMVGENGPEIEVTGPARYFSASQTASMLSSSDDATGIQFELSRLRIESVATAQNTAKLIRLLERLIVPTVNGDALQTTTA